MPLRAYIEDKEIVSIDLNDEEWSALKARLKAKYNRGIQMYRFPNSDVQKSVIFEGIKKRLKIV